MLDELNNAIDYIENHLTDASLTLEMISEHTSISDYHFRKVFFYLAGMTLSEYIKSRRLSEANKDLLQGERVTDVAFKYGYQSLDGFTRAFKNWSGFLPSEVIRTGVSKSLPKLSFVITVKGGVIMEFRIEDKLAFNLVGASKRVPMQFEGVNNEIVKLAESITEEQRKEMRALQNVEPYEIVNASYDADADFMKEEGDLTHLIGVLTTDDQVSNQLDIVFLPLLKVPKLTLLPVQELPYIMTVSWERKRTPPQARILPKFAGDVPTKSMIIVSDYVLVEKSSGVFY